MEFWRGWPRTGCRLTPLVSIQNPGPEKCQEVRERELCFFSVLSPRHGGEMVWKKQSSRVLGLCFFSHHFPPCLGLRHWKNKVLSLSLPDIFQDQGSGYSLRGPKGILYRISPIQIPSKCWGWSNLMYARAWAMHIYAMQSACDYACLCMRLCTSMPCS